MMSTPGAGRPWPASPGSRRWEMGRPGTWGAVVSRLTVLPFLTGERSPNWNASARAAIVGLALDTTPLEILRAGLESIAYRFGLLHEIMAAALPPAFQIIASGGALLKIG